MLCAAERLRHRASARPARRPQACVARPKYITKIVCSLHDTPKNGLRSLPSSDSNLLARLIRAEVLQNACRTALAFICSACIIFSPGPAPELTSALGHGWPLAALPAAAAEAYNVAAYETAVAGRRSSGDDDGGPDLSLFTDDAREAMARLRAYARYVKSVCPAEEACGQQCTENREVLEKAWQVVASEHFSASGKFTQAWWADALLAELKAHDGLIRSKEELHAATSHLMAQLEDPYTEFLPPAAFRRALRRPLPREQSYLRAQYVGLGLELGPVAPEGGRLVLAPLAGSPAEAAGIARGDRLISIDGTPVDQLGVEQLRGLMRGPAGSTATLEWVPAPTVTVAPTTGTASAAGGAAAAAAAGGGGAVVAGGSGIAVGGGRIVMDVERRDLPQPAIKVSRIAIGPPGFYATYVRLLFFGSETTEGLEAVLRREEPSLGNVGYILDLRNNPGGVFEEALASASLFLSTGDIIAKTIRGPEEVVDTVWQVGSLPEEVFPSLPGRLSAKPVVLLGNRSTASAAEVFSGALRDNGRGVLLGERTFGKGLVQYYFPLREGKDGGVRVTVAKYLTPSGYDISARAAGLSPDRACTDFPHGDPPSSLQQSDQCIRQAAALLGTRL